MCLGLVVTPLNETACAYESVSSERTKYMLHMSMDAVVLCAGNVHMSIDCGTQPVRADVFSSGRV